MTPAPRSTPVGIAERRGLRALLAAGGVSAVGDGAFLAAAPLAAVAITRNPTAVAAVAAAEYLPWVVVAPFAGVYVDRWSKRPTMIVADVVRGTAVAALAVLIGLDTASIPAIAVCAAVVVTGMVFHSAASEAVIADLSGRDELSLHKINGRLQAATTTGRQLLGPPGGSLSFTIAGWLPFATDAISFLASAALLAAVPGRPAESRSRTRLWPAIREGAVYLIGNRDLRTLALLTAAGNMAVAAGMATLVLFATDPQGLDVSTAAYGPLLAAMAVGGILGGLAAGRLIRLVGSRASVVGGLAIQAIVWVLLASTHNAVVAGLLLAVLWISFAVMSVVIMAARQRQTPPVLLGRVISAYRIVGNGISPLGALAGGLAAATWGLRAPMLVAAAIVAIAVVPAVGGLRNR